MMTKEHQEEGGVNRKIYSTYPLFLFIFIFLFIFLFIFILIVIYCCFFVIIDKDRYFKASGGVGMFGILLICFAFDTTGRVLADWWLSYLLLFFSSFFSLLLVFVLRFDWY